MQTMVSKMKPWKFFWFLEWNLKLFPVYVNELGNFSGLRNRKLNFPWTFQSSGSGFWKFLVLIFNFHYLNVFLFSTLLFLVKIVMWLQKKFFLVKRNGHDLKPCKFICLKLFFMKFIKPIIKRIILNKKIHFLFFCTKSWDCTGKDIFKILMFKT